MLKKIVTTTAALVAAVVVFLLATLPPNPTSIALTGVDPDLLRRTIRGAYHVHTTESDGSGDRATVAAAAARAGLQFVIFTDHGDGTRPPVAPAYIEGVLCLNGVEVSTNGGHYVALDMPASPYRLGGEAAAVVEDVTRLGGFGIAAHPHHPRPELAWADWSAPIQGIEWINLDSEWRDDGVLRLARIPFDYLLRPAAAIGSLLDRPVGTLKQWDTLERSRPVVALAAADAHGSGRRAGEGRAARLGIGPSYEAGFRTLSNNVLLERPLDGTAAHDARLVFDAIRQGSVYSVIDSVTTGVVLKRRLGDGAFEPAATLPEGSRPVPVEHDGRRRLEVGLTGSPGDPPVPWVVTNWSGPRGSAAATEILEPSIAQSLTLASPWRVEKDPASTGDVSESDGALSAHFALANGGTSQFVAVAADLLAGQTPLSGLTFEAAASKPMRVSVQLRFADGGRWVKSVYLDPSARQVTIRTDDMVSADRPGAPIPDPATAASILFVIDLVNSKPGDSGSFTIRELRRV